LPRETLRARQKPFPSPSQRSFALLPCSPFRVRARRPIDLTVPGVTDGKSAEKRAASHNESGIRGGRDADVIVLAGPFVSERITVAV